MANAHCRQECLRFDQIAPEKYLKGIYDENITFNFRLRVFGFRPIFAVAERKFVV